MESKRKSKGKGRGRNVYSETNSGSLNDSPSGVAGSTGNGLQKFNEACAQMQKSVQQFVRADNEYESSDEEEIENQTEIFQQITSSYIGLANNASDSNFQELGRTRQFLLDSFKFGASVCLVCIATVKKNDATWNCEFCYGIFHIPCIQKWAKESIFCQEQNMQNEVVQSKSITWFCPKCRFEYTQSQKPSKYFCFCNKEVDPPYDPWLVPHSCGNTCAKPLKPECGHFCLLLCHPGPCPPCPKTIQASCFCGGEKPQLKRCSARDWSCGKRCNHLLSCKQHKCKAVCHSGACEPCGQKSVQKCICGESKMERLCADAVWQCEKVCGRDLDCGHHKCEIKCHAGKCAPCPKTGIRTCPCGKSTSKLACTEEVPSCGDTCGKSLECMVHYCSSRCHFGPCGSCLQVSTKRCRCKHREKLVPCQKDFRCDTKCKKFRDCGRHLCNRKCCDGACPLCEQLCGRLLGCHNHKCSSQCHQGPCYPCPLTVDLKCNCGSATITVPCGREKYTKPPKCTKLCKNPPDCHHPSRTKHNCHFGPCSPCQQTCSKRLENCQHTCPVKCHSAVVVKVTSTKTRQGPWEPTPLPKFEVINKQCPPCKVPAPVTCLGLHEITMLPCAEAKPSSCGRDCGRQLHCGNHKCSLRCHKVEDAPDKSMAGLNCASCEKLCSRKRPAGCTHECVQLCHPQACNACKQMIKLRCHCQLSTIYVECNKWTTADEKEKTILASCKNQCPKTIVCGHRCPLNCHPGICSTPSVCKKKVAARCPCKRIKKDVNCHLSKTVKIECDAKCEELRAAEAKAKKEEDERKKQEKMKEDQAEYEKYCQKLEGKKRKQRKFKEDQSEKNGIFDNTTLQILACVGAVVVAAVGIYLLY